MINLLAQSPSGSSPVDFIQYGVLGLVLVGLLLGWLWAKPAVDGLKRDKEKAEAQRDELLRMYEDKVIPSMVEYAQFNAALKPILEQVLKKLEDDRGRSS